MSKAVEAVFWQSIHISCWFHRLANIWAKLPDDKATEVLAHLHDAPTLDAARAAAGRLENSRRSWRLAGRTTMSATSPLPDPLPTSRRPSGSKGKASPRLAAVTNGCRAVVYLRVSTASQVHTDRDAEGLSIPAQREACYRKAETIGAQVVEEYVDAGESARKSDRPALQRMLKRLSEEGDVDYVIVHKVDRLARNRADDVTINLAIREAGAALVSVTENIDETPSGTLLHKIMASISQFYSKNLAAEVSKGMDQKAKKGGRPGKAPVGYMNIREMIDGNEIRTVVLHPERAEHVRWAFESYATGDHTVRTLTTALKERGLRTSRSRK
jgi:DNA invertase Pin-like site-specific DNA recombinase